MEQITRFQAAESLLSEIQRRMPEADHARIALAYERAKTLYGEKKHRFMDMTVFEQVTGITRDALTFCADEDAIIACLLQHVLRYSSMTLQELEEEFGHTVREIVSGLHLLSHVRTDDRRRSIEDLRLMMVSVSGDVRVVLLSLIRRCFNLRNLARSDSREPLRLCRETLQLFAPVAARLGIYALKQEMENLAFPVVYPVEHENIVAQINARSAKYKGFLQHTVSEIRSFLQKEGITATIDGREKLPYSVFLKQHDKSVTDVEEIHDLYAVRVLVDTEADCYQALGLLHRFAVPLSHRFKDYISFPKPNGYQSLHTCLMRVPGSPPDVKVEIQIRTQDMHRDAEYGIAAHWRYKEGVANGAASKAQFMNVLQRQQLGVLTRKSSADDVLRDEESEKGFTDHIYTLTPRGDIIELPEDATPLDFAFSIHSDIGIAFKAAKVNGTIVPLSHKLENGDVVEIITHKPPRPSHHWLEEVRTSQAKGKLKAYFASHDREGLIARGKELLNAELLFNKLAPLDPDLSALKTFDGVALSIHEREDQLVKIGQGSIKTATVLRHLDLPKPVRRRTQPRVERVSRKEHIVRIGEGVRMPLRFAKCCSADALQSRPPITGFITRTGEVSVHRSACGMLKNANKERMIHVEWA